MIASGTIIIDGQTYRKGDVIHDLGGWDCIDTDGSKRYYWGKSSEVDKIASLCCKWFDGVMRRHRGIIWLLRP